MKKKWKKSSFAAGANLDVIEKGTRMLGTNFDEIIIQTIEGMKKVAGEIGLKG